MGTEEPGKKKEKSNRTVTAAFMVPSGRNEEVKRIYQSTDSKASSSYEKEEILVSFSFQLSKKTVVLRWIHR